MNQTLSLSTNNQLNQLSHLLTAQMYANNMAEFAQFYQNCMTGYYLFQINRFLEENQNLYGLINQMNAMNDSPDENDNTFTQYMGKIMSAHEQQRFFLITWMDQVGLVNKSTKAMTTIAMLALFKAQTMPSNSKMFNFLNGPYLRKSLSYLVEHSKTHSNYRIPYCIKHSIETQSLHLFVRKILQNPQNGVAKAVQTPGYHWYRHLHVLCWLLWYLLDNKYDCFITIEQLYECIFSICAAFSAVQKMLFCTTTQRHNVYAPINGVNSMCFDFANFKVLFANLFLHIVQFCRNESRGGENIFASFEVFDLHISNKLLAHTGNLFKLNRKSGNQLNQSFYKRGLNQLHLPWYKTIDIIHMQPILVILNEPNLKNYYQTINICVDKCDYHPENQVISKLCTFTMDLTNHINFNHIHNHVQQIVDNDQIQKQSFEGLVFVENSDENDLDKNMDNGDNNGDNETRNRDENRNGDDKDRNGDYEDRNGDDKDRNGDYEDRNGDDDHDRDNEHSAQTLQDRSQTHQKDLQRRYSAQTLQDGGSASDGASDGAINRSQTHQKHLQRRHSAQTLQDGGSARDSASDGASDGAINRSQTHQKYLQRRHSAQTLQECGSDRDSDGASDGDSDGAINRRKAHQKDRDSDSDGIEDNNNNNRMTFSDGSQNENENDNNNNKYNKSESSDEIQYIDEIQYLKRVKCEKHESNDSDDAHRNVESTKLRDRDTRNSADIFRMQVDSASPEITDTIEQELFGQQIIAESSQTSLPKRKRRPDKHKHKSKKHLSEDIDSKISELPDSEQKWQNWVQETTGKTQSIKTRLSKNGYFDVREVHHSILDFSSQKINQKLHVLLSKVIIQLRCITADIVKHFLINMLDSIVTPTDQALQRWNKEHIQLWSKLMKHRYGSNASLLLNKTCKFDLEMDSRMLRANLLDNAPLVWSNLQTLFQQDLSGTTDECMRLYTLTNSRHLSTDQQNEYNELLNQVSKHQLSHITFLTMYSALTLLNEQGYHACAHKNKRNRGKTCHGYQTPITIMNTEFQPKVFMSASTNILSCSYDVVCNPNRTKNVYVLDNLNDINYSLTAKYLKKKMPLIEFNLALTNLLMPVIGLCGMNQQFGAPNNKLDFLPILAEAEMHISAQFQIEKIFEQIDRFDKTKSYNSDEYYPNFGQTVQKKKSPLKCPSHMRTAAQRINNLYAQLYSTSKIAGSKMAHTVMTKVCFKGSVLLCKIQSPFGKNNNGKYCNVYKDHVEQSYSLEIQSCGKRISTFTPTQLKIKKLSDLCSSVKREKQHKLSNGRKTRMSNDNTNSHNTNSNQVLTVTQTNDRHSRHKSNRHKNNNRKNNGSLNHTKIWTSLFEVFHRKYDNLDYNFLEFLCKKHADKNPNFVTAESTLRKYLKSGSVVNEMNQWLDTNRVIKPKKRARPSNKKAPTKYTKAPFKKKRRK